MEIMDFVLIGATVLFALIGLIKGGAKMFFGLFMLLVIMVGSAFISAAICPLFLRSEKDGAVTYSGAATVLMDPISGALPSDGTFGMLLDAEVKKNEDGEYYIRMEVTTEGEEGEPGETYSTDVKLTEAVAENVPFVGSFAASFVEKSAHPGETLRTTFAYKLTEYAYEAALWVILVIILAIIRNIIRKKIYIYLDKNPGPSKVDRVIGLVLNLAILLVILWGAGALIAHFDDGANWANTADNFLTSGMLANPLMCNNPLLKLMGITLPITA